MGEPNYLLPLLYGGKPKFSSPVAGIWKENYMLVK
jgi:hypothetical protein